MSDKFKHPLRRKHRRGKRGGRKKALQLAPTPPEKIVSLRARLHALKQKAS